MSKQQDTLLPCVKLMRGVPGAGKTHFAKQLHNLGTAIMSADDAFVGADGVYRFDPAELGAAHRSCFLWYMDAIRTKVKRIVVHNTFLSAWELAPYVLAGEAHGYDVEILDVVCDPEVAWRRQEHGVPWSLFRRMVNTWRSEALPAHWKIIRVSNTKED